MSQQKYCARMEFNDSEANTANQTRNTLLRGFVSLMQQGLPADGEQTQAQVERYRSEYIDPYLFPSTPIQIFGMGTAIAVDAGTRKICEDYAEGLADYLSQAMICYYQNCKV